MAPPAAKIAALLADGGRVAVEAVPGAGKTHLLHAVCDDGLSTLILAYNRELASEISAALAEAADANATCLTFHALCGRCLAPACDDTELETAVERAERGELVPHDIPHVERLCIDEAQDVRDLYVRLVRCLDLARPGVQVLVVGDRNQLVYDFDEHFPATLRTLLAPQTLFGGGRWAHAVLETSRRLTSPMARFVNSLFGTRIVSRREGPPVEVRAPRSMYAGLYPVLADLLHDEAGEVLLLVDRKRGHRALRTLLNTASRAGRRLRVHGLDDDFDDATDKASSAAIECGTYWSAKGLQQRVVIVLLPGRAPRNPTYVALTRACERLVVVLDPREPHAGVCAAVAADPSLVAVHDECAARTLRKGAGGGSDPAGCFGRRPRFPPRAGQLRCVDFLQPARPAVAAARREGTLDGPPDDPPPLAAAVGQVALVMGLVRAEHEATGAVRAMEDILHPSRLDFDAVPEAVRLGLMSRVVPRYVSDEELLAEDLRDLALRSYRNVESLASLANVALAVMSWDAWDHTMRALQPTRAWAPEVEDLVDFVVATVPRDAQFDVRLLDEERGCYVRVHATTLEACYHVVWEGTTADVSSAAVRAAVHPAGLCRLVVAATRRVEHVFVGEAVRDALLIEPAGNA